jgi:hypothetical protein
MIKDIILFKSDVQLGGEKRVTGTGGRVFRHMGI